MMKIRSHGKCIRCMTVRPVCLSMVIMAGAFLSVPALSDDNGPWTPEQSKTANNTPGEPIDPRGFYPPTNTTSEPTTDSQPTTSSPDSTPSHYGSGSNTNNGMWTPELSKTANNSPSDPRDPRGFYPPITGSPNDKPTDLVDDMSDLGSKIATSNLANPLIQGGKAIGRTYEASSRGDMTAATVEAADGIGRLSAIGIGATEGAAWGSALGPVGTFLGGVVGGFIGNSAWNATGGAINESSRQALDQQRSQTRDNAQQIRQNIPTRPSSGGGGGGDCGRH
jgi:hypothetical protein